MAICLFLPAVDTLSWFFPKNVDVFLNKYTRPEKIDIFPD